MTGMVQDPEFAERVSNMLRDGAEQLAFDAEDEGVELGNGLVRIETFEEAMLLTRDRGFVMHFSDGSSAQVTVQALTPRKPGDLPRAWHTAFEKGGAVEGSYEFVARRGGCRAQGRH